MVEQGLQNFEWKRLLISISTPWHTVNLKLNKDIFKNAGTKKIFPVKPFYGSLSNIGASSK